MSIKSQSVKNFINQTGVEKQLFVFVGSDTSNSTSNSPKTAIDLWNNSDFSIRVGQNSLCAVVPNVKWIQKRSYFPWSSTTENTGNFYAYNEQNGYVYLCISDNTKNKITESRNISNIRPTHTTGIQQYSDGYSWLPLYKITSSLERFTTTQWLPVVSFDTFDNEDQQTQLQKTQTFCDSNTSEVGNCAIYAKEALSTDDNSGTIEYQKGDLFTIAENITCSDCHYLMFKNDKFDSVFYSSNETIPTNISITDTYDEVGSLISLNQISSASPYYHLYNLNENDGLDEGCVISAFIDLSSFTTQELTMTVENPELIIASNTGSGAVIRLLTTIINDQYVLDGIEVVSRGSGYKDIVLSSDDTYFPYLSADPIIDKISVNLDKIDHIGFDPLTVLNSQHVMIDARIEKQNLVDSGIILPTNVNFFGLLENPLGISGSTEVVSGTNVNKKLDYIYRTSIKVEVSVAGSSSLLPVTSEIYDTTANVTDDNLSSVVVGGVTDVVNAATSTCVLELKNTPYSKSTTLVGSQLNGPLNGSPKLPSTVTTVLSTPTFVQYTGNILSTTKLTSDLPVADVDSVIIRINMVRGM